MSKIRDMAETQVDNKCEELFNRIMRSMFQLKRMYVKLKDENLKQDNRAFEIYKACLMIEHIESCLFEEAFKDEVYQELKEWEHNRNDMREHAMDSFYRFLEKGAR